MTLPEITSEPLLPRGVKDFLPAKAAKISFLTETALELFRRWGFRPVVPPTLEYLDVLERGMGHGLRDKTFRFDDRQDGKLIAFSPDMTPQVARIVATRMHEMPLPLRLCYSGRVLRHAEQQSGKDREIFQVGVELIGLQSPEADAEMIAMAIESLKAFGATTFTIDVGQVEFYRGVMAQLDLPESDLRALQALIARKEVTGLTRLLDTLALPAAVRAEVLVLPRLFGGREVLEKAAATVHNARSCQALANLRQVLAVLETYGLEEHVTFDLGELRGLDYHSGITFQGFLPGLGRAVCQGGRYDHLTARYGYPAAATGFAFDLLNLLSALDLVLEHAAEQSTDVLLFQSGADKQAAQKIAQALRERGYSAARDIIPRSLEESTTYAKRMSFRHVLVVEAQQAEVRVIWMDDGHERTIPLQAILDGDVAL
jgi:ATP phosphoribosyltransferase regulatory subunit